MRKVQKSNASYQYLFLITFRVMMLSTSSNGMIVNTDVAGSGCHLI